MGLSRHPRDQMSKSARGITSLLDLASLGPGPVNTMLHETIRSIGKHMRARAATGKMILQDQTQDHASAGLLDDERVWRIEVEPEAVVIAAAAERMGQILDGAFRAEPRAMLMKELVDVAGSSTLERRLTSAAQPSYTGTIAKPKPGPPAPIIACPASPTHSAANGTEQTEYALTRKPLPAAHEEGLRRGRDGRD
jgi:hypothetical protein